MAEYYYYLNNVEQPVQRARRNHKWTALEKAAVYFVFATKANEVGLDKIRTLVGGHISSRPHIAEMVKEVRKMAKGCLDDISDDAIHSQINQCGYSLIKARNGYTNPGQEDLYHEIHREMKVWNGLQ